MMQFLFAPRFHYVGLLVFFVFVTMAREAQPPAWATFICGALIAAANDITIWRDK